MKNSRLRLDPWPALSLAAWGRKVPQGLLLVGSDSHEAPGAAWCRTLLCEDAGAIDCPCRACQKPLEDHPDLTILAPEPHTIKIDAVRDALRALPYRPLWASTRVIWIREADKLGIDAANLLLKILEEPAPFVHFLLTTEHPDQVLATIRSRCQRIHFSRLSANPVQVELRRDWMLVRPLLPEHVIEAVWHVERAFRHTQEPAWLTLWDHLFEAHQALASNANQDVWRERIRQWWARS